jgi:hypothetical protein
MCVYIRAIMCLSHNMWTLQSLRQCFFCHDHYCIIRVLSKIFRLGGWELKHCIGSASYTNRGDIWVELECLPPPPPPPHTHTHYPENTVLLTMILEKTFLCTGHGNYMLLGGFETLSARDRVMSLHSNLRA